MSLLPVPMTTEKDRDGSRRGSSQKTMLSKALQKANTAVLLDNATNYEGAIEAYGDACQLLHQVMRRSGGDDEKQKLEEIVRLRCFLFLFFLFLSCNFHSLDNLLINLLFLLAKHLYYPH